MNTAIPANIVLANESCPYGCEAFANADSRCDGCALELDIPVPTDALSCPCGCCTRQDAVAGTGCFDMRKAVHGSQAPRPVRQVIDHSCIPADHLAIAQQSAKLDPDGQVFPWQPAYPLIGSTAYYNRRLWTVVAREREVGPVRESDLGMLKLVGQGHDELTTATRGELRPITWSQGDEDWLGVEA